MAAEWRNNFRPPEGHRDDVSGAARLLCGKVEGQFADKFLLIVTCASTAGRKPLPSAQREEITYDLTRPFYPICS